MAKLFRYLITSAASLLACAHTVVAADSVAPERALKFTVFATQPIERDALSFAVREKAVMKFTPLLFFPSTRSPEYVYSGPATMLFHDSGTKEIVAQAELPEGIREALVIFVPVQPAASRGIRFNVFVLDDERSKSGGAGLDVVNFSGFELVGKIDRERVSLPKGFIGHYASGASAQVQFDVLFKGRAVRAYSDKIKSGAGRRALLLLLPPYYSGSLELQHRVLADDPSPKSGKS